MSSWHIFLIQISLTEDGCPFWEFLTSTKVFWMYLTTFFLVASKCERGNTSMMESDLTEFSICPFENVQHWLLPSLHVCLGRTTMLHVVRNLSLVGSCSFCLRNLITYLLLARMSMSLLASHQDSAGVRDFLNPWVDLGPRWLLK